ncbi:hypothetical protein AB6C85_22720 [Vibrio splendidus]
MNNFEARCLTTYAFLRTLPSVKPKLALEYLLHLSPARYPKDEFLHECYESGYWATEKIKISPSGAKFVLSLYEAGLLPMKHKTPQPYEGDYPSDAAFADGIKEEEEERQRYKEMLSDPSAITPDQLYYTLLNDLFFHHDKSGDSQLSVGGIEVSKSVRRYSSNSGKTSDYEVTFTWQQDGEHHSVTKDSIHKGNRRNDGRALAHLE